MKKGSGGSGSRSGGKSVSVSGYYRSNGTYVSGYTRSGSGCGNSRSSSLTSGSAASASSQNTVQVKGYTRSDGTKVSGYTRASPSTSKSSCSGASNSMIKVSGYTRSDGTQVSGHTRAAPGTSNKGISRSDSSSQSTVQVKGYTRSDGTKVSGYTRASPSTSKSSCSATSNSMIKVSGYTRSDGTQVLGYTRAAPGTSNGGTSGSGANSQNTVQVKGYTRSDGTKVSGYTRAAPCTSKSSNSTDKVSRYSKNDETQVSGSARAAPGARNSAHSSNLTTVQVGGYIRGDGTKVLGYTRGISQKCATSNSAIGTQKCPTSDCDVGPQKCYVDNPYNRKIGRVGKPLGSCIIHKDEYQPMQRSQKHQQLLGEYLLEDLMEAMRNITLPISESLPNHEYEYEDYQYAADQLQRDEVEEKWKQKSIEPSNVDVSDLTSQYPKVLVPYASLQLEKVVGRGGFGEVYAACLSEKPVAFKKLLYQRISLRQMDSFVKEVTVLSAINHPNVIKMIGAVIEENNIGIVMEYLRCSLFRAVFVDCNLQDAGKKHTIIGQVANALEHLHSKNIAHCDIKSENILLDWNDNAKLCDFGLSALKSETSSSQSNLAPPGQGTPRYSAPEVLRGEILNMAQLLQADIYSLAIVVFEVMAEEEAFQGLNIMQLQRNVGYGEMRPPTSDLSKPLKDLLAKCWVRDGGERPAASEFQEDWDNVYV